MKKNLVILSVAAIAGRDGSWITLSLSISTTTHISRAARVSTNLWRWF